MTKNEVLKKYFGYDKFRPLQAEIIDTILAKKNCLVLMPTGGGKSVCFQVPAMVMDGMTVVISPLIALMKDQVQGLQANGIAAAYINSSLSSTEINEIENACLSGQLKLLYIAPEKLFSNNYISFLKRLTINQFAIDESHCVSFWGHDFRPEYTQLHILKTEFPDVPTVALTATADKVTRKDILAQLGIPDAQIFISSFDRPNLSLTVLPGLKRLQRIQDFLDSHKNQSGIIYCLSRKSTESVAASLQKAGFKAKHFHAGMDTKYRSMVQDEFIKDDIQIIVATIAFGMGIDKSNVRWVIHYNLPKNVESFYQEIGRAGRDGLPSDTVLFYSFSDYMAQKDMNLNSDITTERRDLLDAKLDRMKQYAESEICRRRILLSYFNETVTKDCGNCDVCRNPKSKFEATLIAQKALSAIARTDEKIAMSTLIDILRGSQNRNIFEKGYNNLKTFGVGKDLKGEEWADYLSQMLNSGVMDIAYDEGHAFKLNETSWKVLKSLQTIHLIKFMPYELKKQQQETEKLEVKSKKEIIKDALFERLRTLRKQLADERNIPPFVIFSDATLSDMAQKKPINQSQMMKVSGVAQLKFNLYGAAFMKEIVGFIKENTQMGKTIDVTGMTYLVTHDLYTNGYGIDEMAKIRNLTAGTIVGHLLKLRDNGQEINFKKFVSAYERKAILKAEEVIEIPEGEGKLKLIYEALGGEIDYYKLRLVLSGL